MAEEETEGTEEKGPSKKDQRAKLAGSVKEAIEAAGPAGATADTIGRAINLLSDETPEADVKGILHEIRAVARGVIKKEGWSRMNREGRNVLYQAVPPEEAQVQKDAADQAKKDAATEKRAAKKAAKTEADGGEENDGDDGDDGEDDDPNWEEGEGDGDDGDDGGEDGE